MAVHRICRQVLENLISLAGDNEDEARRIAYNECGIAMPQPAPEPDEPLSSHHRSTGSNQIGNAAAEGAAAPESTPDTESEPDADADET